MGLGLYETVRAEEGIPEKDRETKFKWLSGERGFGYLRQTECS